MFANLALGTLLIGVTVIIQTVGFVLLSHFVARLVLHLRLHRHDVLRTLAMVATVLGLFFVHTIEVWLWAAIYVAIHATPDIADALYLSTASFTTLGAERPADEWRLLTALESMDGFLLIGWSIAFLIAASTRHGPFRAGEHF